MILRSRAAPRDWLFCVFLERRKRLESSYSQLSVSAHLFLSLTIVKCVFTAYDKVCVSRVPQLLKR